MSMSVIEPLWFNVRFSIIFARILRIFMGCLSLFIRILWIWMKRDILMGQ